MIPPAPCARTHGRAFCGPVHAGDGGAGVSANGWAGEERHASTTVATLRLRLPTLKLVFLFQRLCDPRKLHCYADHTTAHHRSNNKEQNESGSHLWCPQKWWRRRRIVNFDRNIRKSVLPPHNTNGTAFLPDPAGYALSRVKGCAWAKWSRSRRSASAPGWRRRAT